jgi:aminoglycoside phosphotransferase (APT) family kinase protein
MSEATPGIDVPRVGQWLDDHIGGAAGPYRFDLITGGHSNLTYRVTGADGQRYVLRRPPLGHVLASAHDMGREHRIIAALQDTPVPVAPALGLCTDPAVNGAPFYVMGFVDGHVVRDRAQVESLLTPDQRRTGRKDGYITRQLKRWYGQWDSQKTRDLPAVDEVHDALASRIPDQREVCVVHGDYRLDNCMVGDDGRILAVFDWEICTLGDPLADVGLLQVYHTGPDDEPSAWTSEATAAAGFPNRGELLTRYGEVSGRDVGEIDFYVAFAFWKLACILEGVYARYLGGALGKRDPAELLPFKLQVDAAAVKAAEYVARL